MQQLRPVAEHIEPGIAMVPIPVHDMQQASLDVMGLQQGCQLTAGFARIGRQSALGEVKLVGAVDELDDAVQATRQVVADGDPDVALAQK